MKVLLTRLALVGLLALSLGAAKPTPTPRPRPLTWAQPVLDASLKNLHQVSTNLFRSSQPDKADTATLLSLGIRSIINLREHHDDKNVKALGPFQLQSVEMDAGEVTPSQLLQALRCIRDAPKPVLVHCWHGSDRTGVVVAAYRMVFQGWSAAEAIDEMKSGEFGYHARTYPNLVELLQTVDAAQWRKDLGLALN